MAGSTTYQYILSLQDKMTGVLHRAGITGSQTYDKLQAKQERLNASVQSFNGLMGKLGITFGLFGAIQFGKKILTAGADIEATRITFQTLLQDIEKGNAMVRELQDYANVTPFESTDLQEAAKLLLNFGVAGDKIMPTLKLLGDVSGGNSQKLQQLTLAYSQMTSAGRLMGQDLLQMINAGFNPLQEISRKTGKSMAVLRKEMEGGRISSAMVEQAFISATSEGGRFYGMMDKMGQTIKGRWSTLMDKISLTFAKWGDLANATTAKVIDKLIQGADWLYRNSEGIFTFFKSVISSFSFVFDAVKKVFAVISDLFKSLGENKNILVVLQVALGAVFVLFRAAFSLASRLFVSIISSLASVIKWLNNHRIVLSIIVSILGTMTERYIALRTAVIANNIVMAISSRLALEQALAGKTLTIWQGLAALATKGWSAAVVKLNLAFLANPIFWIITGIEALITAISYVIYKTDGWGKMWQHTVNGAKMLWQTFTDYVNAYFGEMVNGIIIAIDKVIASFYKAKNAVGLGNEKKNNEQIARYEADASKRKEDITSAWKKVKDDAFGAATEFKLAGQSLTWNSDKKIGDLVDKIGGKRGIGGKNNPVVDADKIGGKLGIGGKNNPVVDADKIGGKLGIGGKNNPVVERVTSVMGGKNNPVVERATSVMGGIESPLSTNLKNTSESITKGGSKQTTINITLGNLVEQLSINTNTVQEGVQDMEVKVREALLRVLNSANGVAYGN